MTITASVQPQSISASVSDNVISAKVSTSVVSASAAGGVGPAGPAGATTIAGASDVAIQSIKTGDVLRFGGTKWNNYPEENLTDGGNF
jgi:hypothetical protein